jgi:hypothetical protein
MGVISRKHESGLVLIDDSAASFDKILARVRDEMYVSGTPRTGVARRMFLSSRWGGTKRNGAADQPAARE